MKYLINHGPLLALVLGLGASVGCVDDHASTTPVEVSGEADPGVTAVL